MGGLCSRPDKRQPDSPVRLSLHPSAAQETAKPPVQLPERKLRKDAKVRDVYKIGKTLGTGGFAVVKLATDRATGEEFAAKIMSVPEGQVGDNETTREDIFREIDILVGLNHPNVIFLKEYFEEGGRVYLITELLTGGELLDAVLQKGSYSEADARNAFRQLIEGIQYLHSVGIAHRDLKLENILLTNQEDGFSQIKLADYGLAKKLAEGQLQTVCGTPNYVAPEVIQGTPGLMYSPAVDMWSSGVVLFVLLGGYPPFYDESEPQLFQQIRRGTFSFDDPVWETVSDEAKDLIRRLLVTDPAKRLTATQALAHPWMTGSFRERAPADLAAARANMRHNMRRHRFKDAVTAVVAGQKLERLAHDVHEGVRPAGTLTSDPAELQRYAAAVREYDRHQQERLSASGPHASS